MAFQYNAVSVGSTATQILPSNPARRGCLVLNNGSSTMYLGMDANVTTSNGFPIAAGSSLSNSGEHEDWRGAIFGIVVTGSVDVRFWEWEN